MRNTNLRVNVALETQICVALQSAKQHAEFTFP